jgi:hypothetical protein
VTQDSRLTAAKFEALCKLLWSSDREGWQRRAAEFLGVSTRAVQYFAAEPPAKSKPVPLAVRGELLGEIARLSKRPDDRARMVAWADRCAEQLEVMREALDK